MGLEERGSAVAGVRLFTRAPVTLPWLSRAVVPLARGLHHDGFAQVRLRRGWQHGPHVDLIAAGGAGRPVPWDDVARRFNAGPLDPATALGEQVYLDQAREFGRLEAVGPPYLPMAEHGATRALEPDETGPREPLLRALPAWSVAHAALTTPLLDTIDELATRPGLASVRLTETFAAIADTYFLGLAHGAYSFRSHVEAFFAWVRPSRDVRPVFAERLRRDADRLRPVIEQRLSGDVSRAGAAWRAAFAYAAGTLDSAVGEGRLTLRLLDDMAGGLDTAAMGPPSAPDAGPTGAQPDSDFHRQVADAGVLAAATDWFASYRALLNLFYQQLPLLTVSPMQRYYTCYAVAELVDEVLGESWQDRLSRSRVRVPEGAQR